MMAHVPALVRRYWLAIALTAMAGGAAAQGAKVFPVDEGAHDPSWTRFKARLVEALARRDRKFVLAMIDAKIRNTSDKDGIAEFKKLWEPHAEGSPLWTELPKVLFLGGVFVKRGRGLSEFCAPYVHYKWPADGDGDAAVIAKEALMTARPAANAQTLQALSYDLVKVLDWEVADEDKDSSQRWVKIEARAVAGYVPEEQIRSPLEYRACFVKGTAGWRMTGLEVGE